MDIPEDFVAEVISNTVLSPAIFSKYNDIFNAENNQKIIETEDLQTVLTFLKLKFIRIYKKFEPKYSFNLKDLYDRISENDFILLHDILFYSLIIHPSLDAAEIFLNKSCDFLSNNSVDKNSNAILQSLEIIDVILELFTLHRISLNKKEIHDTILNLITNDDSNIRKKIIIDIIPKYVENINDNSLFFEIWQKIQNTSLEICIIVALEIYFIPVTYNKDIFNILTEEDYWKSLQRNMSNPLAKKQSQYLLKKSIETLFNNEKYKNFVSEIDIIKWDVNNLREYKNAWKNLIILYETTNEKQVHLVEPTFKLYSSLNILDKSWKNIITKLFINHSHSAVVKSTIINILKREWYCEIDLLVHGLDNNFLYENSSGFTTFIKDYISSLNQEDYSIFLSEIIKNSPSPIPFYYICKVLTSCEPRGASLKMIIHLINLAEKLPHLYIRKGILHNLFLYFFTVVTNLKIVETNDFVQIVYLLHSNCYIQRDSYPWKKLLNLFTSDKNIYENFSNKQLKTSKESAVSVVLLMDAKIIPKNWISNYLLLVNDLESCNTLFTAINARTIPDEIFEENILSYNDIDIILNKLLIICNTTEYYTTHFFDNIEFILDTIVNKTFLDQNDCILFINFFKNLENNAICFIILSKKLTELYDLRLKYISKDDLTNLSRNIKQVNFNTDLKRHESDLKQKLFQNYYYTKLNIRKLLIKIDSNNETSNILSKINNYYERGSQDTIILVIDTIYTLINNYNFCNMETNFITEFLNLIIRCQNDIFNLRTNELFRPAITKFITTVLHPQMFQYDLLKEYAHNFCLNMFDSSQIVAGIRNEILNRIPVQNLNNSVLIEGLLYGQILRKDQRIELATCDIISKDIKEWNFDLIYSYELDRRVRSKSVSILLSIIYKPHYNSSAKQFYEKIFLLLLEKYKKSAGKRYFGDSQIHLLKLRILQSLHLIVTKLSKNSMNTLYKFLFDCLINESQQHSIKILIQWLIIRICDILNIKETIINNLMSQIPDLKGIGCTSIFPILYHLIKDRNVNINAVYEVMELLLPYTMGQQFNIRCNAQIAIQHIYQVYQDVPDFFNKYNSIYKTIMNVLNQTTTDKLSDYNLIYYDFSLSIETIFYHIPRLTNVISSEWLSIDYFNDIGEIKLRSSDGLGNLQTNIKRILVSNTEISENMNVQKKIDVHSASKNKLIVVASLIDKAPNLGGLSRTCEVFGVNKLVLNNLQFTKNKEYQSLSMSSENWIETLEVKTENLFDYLLEMQKKHYKIVGAEQTADSKKLNEVKFEKNTVLLLGNEKEGIPPNLIHLLDECIEIPQFGQIRSLNVHVSGALFIWEYVKQHNQTNCVK